MVEAVRTTRGLYLSVITSLVVASCTASGQSSDASLDISAVTTRIDAYCTDLEAADLGGGTLCIDNGFRVTADDFGFANWGRSLEADANVTVQTLVDLFGRSNVCAPGPDGECILRPGTIQKLEEWNTALSGGRCEGLAALATRFHMRLDHPSMFRAGATTVADLQRGDGSLNESIVYWWTTQFLPEVADRAAASRNRSPLELVEELIVGLANSTGHTIGLYQGSTGHAVTPFAVTRRDDSYVVHVYDNNHPGQRREILVDRRTAEWSYPGASQRIDGTMVDWSGTTGTFELTPMSARKGPFRCPFCMIETNEAPTVVTLASRDPDAPGYLSLSSRQGDIVATAESVANSIPGATYVVSKGRTGGLVTVTLPPGMGDFDVSVVRTSRQIPAADVVVSLQRPGFGHLQVSGDLAGSRDDTATGRAVLSVRAGETTVNAPGAQLARVSVAAGNTITRRTLGAGESLVVSRASVDSIEVSLKGSNGFDHGRVPVPFETDAATREVTLTIDANGALATDSARLSPVAIGRSTAVNFTPGATSVPTTTTAPVPRSTVPSIEVSDPD